MDQKTRDLRARNKLTQNKRGELPEFEARGLGKKNKRAETFPAKRCEHIDGGEERYLKKRKKNTPKVEYVSFKLIVGGQRCRKTAIANARCLEHSGGGSQ